MPKIQKIQRYKGGFNIVTSCDVWTSNPSTVEWDILWVLVGVQGAVLRIWCWARVPPNAMIQCGDGMIGLINDCPFWINSNFQTCEKKIHLAFLHFPSFESKYPKCKYPLFKTIFGTKKHCKTSKQNFDHPCFGISSVKRVKKLADRLAMKKKSKKVIVL